MKIFAYNLSLQLGTENISGEQAHVRSLEAAGQALSSSSNQRQSLYLQGNMSEDFIEALFHFQANTVLREASGNVYISFEDTGKAEQAMQAFISRFRIKEAAGGLVRNERGEILMIFSRGRWSLPKGHIEAGEAIRQTAYREVMEETGIESLQCGHELPETLHTFLNKKGRWILKKTYWFDMFASSDQSLQAQAAEQIESAKWVNLTQWPAIAHETYPLTREMLEQFWLSLARGQN